VKTLIIAPHVDDELYSCLGYVLTHAKDTTIAYVTHSEEQSHRFWVLSEIFKKLEISVSLSKLEIFEDTKGNLPLSFHSCLDIFDKLLTNWGFTRVLFNSESHHQDHETVNRAMRVALRSRPSLQVKEAFEYDYCYNNVNSFDRIDLTYDKETFELIKEITKRFDKECRVSKSDEHVSDFNKAFLFNQYIGSFECKPYAESFHIAKYVKEGKNF